MKLKTVQDEKLNTLKEIADALKGNAGIVNTLTQQIANAKTEAVQTAEEDATKKANAAQAEAVKTAKAEATQYTNSKLADYYTKAEVDESQQKQDERIKKLEDARPTSGAGALYDFSKAEAVKTAKAEATQYTNSKLENYYTKTDVDESQRVQDEKIAALEAARPTSGAGAFYDFSKAEAVKTAKAEATQYTDSKLADYYTKTEVDDSQRVQDEKIAALEAARPTSGAGALYDFAQAEAVKTGEKIKLADGTVKDIYRLCVERENVQDNFTIDTSTIGTISRILRINGTLTQTSGVVESAAGAVKLLVNRTDQHIKAVFKIQDTEYSVLLFIEFIL